MQALKARVNKGLNHGSNVPTCDNSGAKLIRIVSILGAKTGRGRKPSCGVGDIVLASVKRGVPEMRKQVVYAIIVRQRQSYRRYTGERIKFEDNAAVVLKDIKGNPKGTIFKGPIAKEVCERWPAVAKVASIIV